MEQYWVHITTVMLVGGKSYKFTHKVKENSPKVHKHLGDFFKAFHRKFFTIFYIKKHPNEIKGAFFCSQGTF